MISTSIPHDLVCAPTNIKARCHNMFMNASFALWFIFKMLIMVNQIMLSTMKTDHGAEIVYIDFEYTHVG